MKKKSKILSLLLDGSRTKDNHKNTCKNDLQKQ